ncbi:hypothetical protein CsSME_00037582 [Camellia sinensis var. sinensis]
MCSSEETQDSDTKPLTSGDYSSSDQSPTTNPDHKNPSKPNPLISLILEPFQWLQMLSNQLSPSFVVGVVLVYGVSQGFSGSFFRVATDYYWKDVQKVQPSSVQLYIGLYYIPWIMKPIWGLLTDVFPVRGYQRRPYFVLAGLEVAVALVCLIGITGGVAIADVTIDACIARNSIEIKSLAPDMQSLCGFCSSVGALVGYSTSGLFVHHLGAQSLEKLGGAMKGMYKTIKFPQVWKPSLYMYMSLALSISTHEGQFYWYTNPKAGPAFTQEFIGIIYAIGALASIVGVLIYHKILKDFPFRNLIFFAQLLYGLSGMLDLIFIFRWNLYLGIPDYLFVVMEECVSRIITRIRWMPMIVLSTRLCPLGIEGTFFALLMCIDSFGSLSSKWGGGMILHLFHVTRTDFRNLWLVVFIRNILRLATLAFIFLIPKVDRSETLIPSDILMKATTIVSVDDVDIQLVPVHENSEV